MPQILANAMIAELEQTQIFQSGLFEKKIYLNLFWILIRWLWCSTPGVVFTLPDSLTPVASSIIPAIIPAKIITESNLLKILNSLN